MLGGRTWCRARGPLRRSSPSTIKEHDGAKSATANSVSGVGSRRQSSEVPTVTTRTPKAPKPPSPRHPVDVLPDSSAPGRAPRGLGEAEGAACAAEAPQTPFPLDLGPYRSGAGIPRRKATAAPCWAIKQGARQQRGGSLWSSGGRCGERDFTPEVLTGAETMLSLLENRQAKPHPVSWQLFIAFGAACVSEASAAGYGGEGRGKPVTWVSGAGRETSRRGSDDGISVGFFSGWRTVPSPKAWRLLLVRLVKPFLEKLSWFPATELLGSPVFGGRNPAAPAPASRRAGTDRARFWALFCSVEEIPLRIFLGPAQLLGAVGRAMHGV